MRTRQDALPASAALAALTAAATYFTLLSWRGLSENSTLYLLPLFWICVVMSGVGLAARLLRVPPMLLPLLDVLVAALALNRLLASSDSLAGWVPTSTSVHQVGLRLADAVDASNQWQAPIPRAAAEAFAPLLLAAGLGVIVLVEVCVGALRRVPLAGLPLLAAFTVPVSLLGGVSWVAFAFAALWFVLLLSVDQAIRLARWGKGLPGAAGAVTDDQPRDVRLGTVWPSASKIALAGVGLAAVAPVILPSTEGLLHLGAGPGGAGGDSVSISNPMVSIRRTLTRGADLPLVEVRTADPDPSYLRLTVLDSFDGTAWRPSERQIPQDQVADGDLPSAPGLTAQTPTQEEPMQISVLPDLNSTWLPAPYPASSVSADGDWRYDVRTLDFVAVGDRLNAAGQNYEATELKLSPDGKALVNAGAVPQALFNAGTQLPSNVPSWIPKLADQVTKGAHSDFERAVKLQDWFRTDGGFTYSLSRASGSGLDQLTTFLGTGDGSRTGYCEQFASAMAMMARALGIPARVAVGFLRPSPQSDGTWVYSAHDLHSWPELYFQGAGWLRFEPTPQSRTESVPTYTSGQIPTPKRVDAPTKPEATEPVGPSPRPDPTRDVERSPSTHTGSVLPEVLTVLGVLVLLALAMTPRLVRTGLRRRRLRSDGDASAQAEAAWAEIRATALDLGLGWDDTVTLRQRARGLVSGLPDRLEVLQALEVVALGVERGRYSRSGLTPGEADVVTAEADELCAAMRDHALPRTRRRATWLPSSLWPRRARAVTPRARGGGQAVQPTAVEEDLVSL